MLEKPVKLPAKNAWNTCLEYLHSPPMLALLITFVHYGSRPAMSNMQIFTGTSHPVLAHDIAKVIGTELGTMTCDRFPDGEVKVQIHEDVRGSDVYIVQSTTTNDYLMELLVITDALRRASARRITAVVPYFGYARQDRKHSGRVPITAKLVANLMTTAGIDRVVTIDLHAMQIQGFFDIPVDHLLAQPDSVGVLTQPRS